MWYRSQVVLFFYLSFTAIVGAQTSTTIEANNSTIYITTYGQGDPVLIINGGPGMSSEGFASLATALSEKNTAIIYDQRGTGRSQVVPISSETITMELMVADIEAVRKHFKYDQWVVMGHSFGGMLAAYYTSKHPDRVSGLILSSSGGVDMSLFSDLNITARLSPQQRDSLQYWNRKIAAGDNSYTAQLKRGKFLAPAYLHDTSHVPVIAERLTQGNSQINSLVYQDLRAIDFDCKAQLSEFEKPVLILQGAYDIIPRSIFNSMINVFPNSTSYILKQSSHYGWLEEPTAYVGYLRSFLSSL